MERYFKLLIYFLIKKLPPPLRGSLCYIHQRRWVLRLRSWPPRLLKTAKINNKAKLLFGERYIRLFIDFLINNIPLLQIPCVDIQQAMKQEQQLGTGSIPSSLQIKTFFIDKIYMSPLEIIIRAKLVRHKYEYLVYYVCNKQPNMCSRLILLCLGIRVFYA